MNGLIVQARESIARPLGQSCARWQLLARAFEPQTVAKMVGDMGQARQCVQRVADVLERGGPVAYAAHPRDRRTKLVTLTGEGRDVLTALFECQADSMADALTWSKITCSGRREARSPFLKRC